MDQKRLQRNDAVRNWISTFVGNENKPGTLKSQVYEISEELGDMEVCVEIANVAGEDWIPNPVGYKYRKFFTHWVVLALSKLIDSSDQSISITRLFKILNYLHQEGELNRDMWIERVGKIEVDDWRAVYKLEKQEHFEEWRSKGGGAINVQVGPGHYAKNLNQIWNKLTGRAAEVDGAKDSMEQWVLDTALHPIKCCHAVKQLKEWRDKFVAHQDKKKVEKGILGYDAYPMKTLTQAYSSIIKAAHRTILLAEGSGLQCLNPISTFNVPEALSGGILNENKNKEIELKISKRYVYWQQFMRNSEEAWYKELRALREKYEMQKK